MTRWIEVDPSVLREELDMADGGRKATIEQCVQVHGETGDIRWRHLYVDPDAPIKGGPFSVLELHRHLQWWADTFTDRMVEQNPSERWSDQHIRLLGRFNIDDEMATHLTDGSIVNANGEPWASSVKFDSQPVVIMGVGWANQYRAMRSTIAALKNVVAEILDVPDPKAQGGHCMFCSKPIGSSIFGSELTNPLRHEPECRWLEHRHRSDQQRGL